MQSPMLFTTCMPVSKLLSNFAKYFSNRFLPSILKIMNRITRLIFKKTRRHHLQLSFKLHLVNLLVRRIDPRNNRQLKFHACYSLSVWTKQFLGFKKQRNTNVLLILMKELNHFCTKKKKKIAMYIHVFFRLANKLHFYCSRNLFIILIFIEKLMNAWGLFMYFFNEHIDHYCIFWTLFFCLLVGLWTNWPGKITLLFQIGYVKHIQPRLCFESFSNGKIGAIAA